MPIRAPSPCRHGGCRELVNTPGFCDVHRKAAFKVQKQTVTIDYEERNRFYQRKEWKNVRALRLQLNPLCCKCRAMGRLVEASVVDHIKPIEDGGGSLDLDNTQSLCKSCHNSKTRTDTNRRGAVEP